MKSSILLGLQLEDKKNTRVYARHDAAYTSKGYVKRNIHVFFPFLFLIYHLKPVIEN